MQSFTINSCKYPISKKEFNKKYKSEIRQAIFNARRTYTNQYNSHVTYNALNYIENLILPMGNSTLNSAMDICYNTNNTKNKRAYINALDYLLDIVNDIEDINLPIANPKECFINDFDLDLDQQTEEDSTPEQDYNEENQYIDF